MSNGVKEDAPGSYTSPRIKEYFSVCTRLINGQEVPIGISKGNWCSASACFSLHESLLPGEVPPHQYRVGVVEVVADLQHHNLYHTVADVKAGKYQIKIGDLIIFDRSNPADPSTAWYRHIGRVFKCDDKGNFKCISGNSSGRWRITDHNLSQTNLLGFGAYPKLKTQIIPNATTPAIPDWSNADILELAPTIDTGKDLAAPGIIIDAIQDFFTKKS